MIEVEEVHLNISSNNFVYLDIKVDGRWRRIINAYHAGITDYYVSNFGMELGDGTMDVTADYEMEVEE